MMANVCLDSQMFSTPVAAEPKSRNVDPPASQSAAVMTSSNDESEHGDFDDGQSDTSFPSIDELISPQSTKMLSLAVLPVPTKVLILHPVRATAMRGNCPLPRGPTKAISLHRTNNRRWVAETVLACHRLPSHYHGNCLRPEPCSRTRQFP